MKAKEEKQKVNKHMRLGRKREIEAIRGSVNKSVFDSLGMRLTALFRCAVQPRPPKTFPLNAEADKFRIKVAKSTAFIDSMRVYCKGGHGGNGYQPKGGHGGTGGNVVLRVDSQQSKRSVRKGQALSLQALFKNNFKSDPKKQRVVAAPGGHSTKFFVLGEPGEDTVLSVPRGVSISSDEGKLLSDLDELGSEVVVAVGGRGGCPENNWIGTKGQGRN